MVAASANESSHIILEFIFVLQKKRVCQGVTWTSLLISMCCTTHVFWKLPHDRKMLYSRSQLKRIFCTSDGSALYPPYFVASIRQVIQPSQEWDQFQDFELLSTHSLFSFSPPDLQPTVIQYSIAVCTPEMFIIHWEPFKTTALVQRLQFSQEHTFSCGPEHLLNVLWKLCLLKRENV